jgi:hypothetical protein
VDDKIESLALCESSEPLGISGLEELRRHSCRMAQSCRRLLRIYAHGLNAEIYNQVCFVEAVRQLAIRHTNTRIMLLVADTGELARGGSRLVQLAQDMPSSLEIRKRAEEFNSDQRSYLLADECGYILRNLWNDLNNVRLDYNSPYKVRNLGDDFLRAWEQSEPDPALRRLSI